MTVPEPQTPTPEPSEADWKEAREIKHKLDNLPDFYVPGADGGLYHAVPPEGVLVIALALTHEREKAAKVMDGIEQTLRDAASSYGRREIGIREDLRREADEVARAAAAIRSGGGR